ncbi:hypothetical protein BJX61DRAFT_549261 [Aspergillus egyptiacus]|nr:hypothetical protein BJX61DRAFT_549261 [Aspergillus egyptiacus]
MIMADNNEDAAIVPDRSEENADSSPAPQNDGKLLLTVIKYDAREAKPIPGGKLAPTPSQLEKSTLGVIRAYLLKGGHIAREDQYKPFCTKDGVEVADDLTLDHYVEENSSSSKPGAAAPRAAGTADSDDATPESTNTDPNTTPVKHNIYLLTKKRGTLNATADAFLKKPLDLSNTAKVDFASAPTGPPLTSTFNSSSWAAESGSGEVHPADMTEKEWGIVMRNNNLLSGQSLQRGEVEKVIKVPGHPDIKRPGIAITNVERSYYSAFALKPRKLPNYDITFKFSEKEDAEIEKLNIPRPDHFFRIPRYHIQDASQVRVFETKGSLETTFAESSFSEDSVDAAVGASVMGFSAAVKGGASWNSDSKTGNSKFNDTNYMHVVYEFPRVELVLNEETLELSDECREDIQALRDIRTLQELEHFEKKYGTFFTQRVHLGGKLVSIDESDSVSGSTLQEKTKMLKAAAGASVSGYGFQAEVNYSHTENSGTKTTSTEKKMTHSMSWSAYGGDTTLCNNPPKWCPTVASFYNWRVMKQDAVVNIYTLIGKIPGYEDIPRLVDNIVHLSADPALLVQFSLHLEAQGHDSGARTLTFGQPVEAQVAPLAMDPLQTNRGEAATSENDNLDKNAPKEMDKSPGKESDKYRATFGIRISNDQSNILIQTADKGLSQPRLKYGIKYPVCYLVKDEDDEDEPLLVHALQIGGDESSNRFLYGKRDQASNVMVEFEPIGKRKSRKATAIGPNDKVRIRFSLLQTDTTVTHVSNFRVKDVDETEKPQLSGQDQDQDLPGKPQPPAFPEKPWTRRDNLMSELNSARKYYRNARENWLSRIWAAKVKKYETRLRELKDTPEDVKALQEYDQKLAYYNEAQNKYEEAMREYRAKLEAASKERQEQYEHLVQEWELHQKSMNKPLALATMVFQLEYHDKNEKDLEKQMATAAKALKAEKEAKAQEAAAAAAEEAAEQAKAAADKAHDEAVERRKKLLFPDIFIWDAQKRGLERVAMSMDAQKAARLREDVKKKDVALKLCAEYSLEEDAVIAKFFLLSNPFFAAAVKPVEIPE